MQRDLVEESPANGSSEFCGRPPGNAPSINQILLLSWRTRRVYYDHGVRVPCGRICPWGRAFSGSAVKAWIRRPFTPVMTQGWTLLGIVTVKDLLLAEDDDQLIQDIMITNIISVSTPGRPGRGGPDAEQIQLPGPARGGRGEPDGRYQTFDDAMDVMEDEFTEDIEIMGGMTPRKRPT